MDKIISAMEDLRIDYEVEKWLNTDIEKYIRANEMLDDCLNIVQKVGQPIYEVLVYSRPWSLDEHNLIDFGSTERVGFYYEKETAMLAIEENWCDLQDHYARAAAVREVLPGLYQYPPFSTYIYYLWDTQAQKWERAEVPVEVGEFC